jgi:hypothetical protein
MPIEIQEMPADTTVMGDIDAFIAYIESGQALNECRNVTPRPGKRSSGISARTIGYGDTLWTVGAMPLCREVRDLFQYKQLRSGNGARRYLTAVDAVVGGLQ